MSFGKKLAGFFIEPDESQKEEVDVVEEASAPVVKRTTAPRRTTAIPSSPIPTNGAPDETIIKTLNDAADASKKKGYVEFRTIFETLDSIPELQRYSMALKLVEKTASIKITDVLDSLKDRIALVDGEQASYEDYYQSEFQKSVVSRQSDVEKTNAAIEAKKAEIRELEQSRVTLTGQAAQAQIDLEQGRATFSSSYDVVRSSLAAELERVASFNIPTPSAIK